MAYVRIKADSYLAIVDEEMMVEVKANSKEEAREGAIAAAKRSLMPYNLDNITVCKIPHIIGCVDWT